MSDYPCCPNLEEVCAEPHRCGSCGEHLCELCDNPDRRDEAGEFICEGCVLYPTPTRDSSALPERDTGTTLNGPSRQ